MCRTAKVFKRYMWLDLLISDFSRYTCTCMYIYTLYMYMYSLCAVLCKKYIILKDLKLFYWLYLFIYIYHHNYLRVKQDNSLYMTHKDLILIGCSCCRYICMCEKWLVTKNIQVLQCLFRKWAVYFLFIDMYNVHLYM